MKTPHKHAEIIKAWADGAEIEIYDDGTWKKAWNPNWYEACVYRIKPELIVKEYNVLVDTDNHIWFSTVDKQKHLRLIFDGETGKLKKAEVLE